MAAFQSPMWQDLFNPSESTHLLPECRSIWVRKQANSFPGTPIDINLQNPTLARFTPCFLPVITAIPAAIGALILLSYTFRLLNLYRPQWTKPFIKEAKESPDDLPRSVDQNTSRATYGLLSVCLFGMSMQAVTIFIPSRHLVAIYPTVSWVCSASPLNWTLAKHFRVLLSQSS
jgi:hypothetical protein